MLAEYSDGKVEPHDCRRFFATENVNQGTETIVLQQLMGHNSIATTNGYVNISSKLKIDRNRL